MAEVFFLKGIVHHKIKNTFFLLPVELFIHLDSFGVSCLVVERFLPSLKYNGTKWCTKCGAHSPKNYF